MGKAIKEKAVAAIKDLLRRKGIDTYKVVIFGSYATGTYKKDSDMDIIVVSKDFEGKDIFKRVELVNGVHSELVDIMKLPIDLLYYSVSEWKKGNSLILNAVKH
ncbi:MAG: hypothetical protein A3J83_07715 [Elusimicrobia bacterium RIFOXYA2_FULL_40_6]|nr:MAG: hypothetical protein A3J83_07715 [Elusimicrobia bacterium RIFOXYA2_FULL_40_6]